MRGHYESVLTWQSKGLIRCRYDIFILGSFPACASRHSLLDAIFALPWITSIHRLPSLTAPIDPPLLLLSTPPPSLSLHPGISPAPPLSPFFFVAERDSLLAPQFFSPQQNPNALTFSSGGVPALVDRFLQGGKVRSCPCQMFSSPTLCWLTLAAFGHGAGC